MKMKFTLLVFLLMCTSLLFAQQTQTVKGKVNNETGQPLLAATVFLTIEKKTASSDIYAVNMVCVKAYGVSLAATGLYPAVNSTIQIDLRKVIRRECRIELVSEGQGI